MKIITSRNKKPIRKREYLPSKYSQRKRDASLVMALLLLTNAASYASQMMIISSQRLEGNSVLHKQEKANAIIGATVSYAEGMKSIIQRQSKLMK